MHRQVDAIQMVTHNICLYKVDKKYTGCNLEITELFDSALIGVCAVIRANTVGKNWRYVYMGRAIRKRAFGRMRTVKAQISLRIHAVW